MTAQNHGDTPSALLELLAWLSISASIFLIFFGSYVWAVDSLSTVDALQNQNIAVLSSQLFDINRRVTSIEDRLFAILLTTGGAVLASVTSTIFSVRTHRRLKNGRTA